MLARLWRLCLLFEIFAEILLAMSLVRLGGWPPLLAFVGVLCLAGGLRFWPIGMGFLLHHFDRQRYRGGHEKLQSTGLWQSMGREWWVFCRMGLACAFERLWLRADLRGCQVRHEGVPLLLVHGYACNRGGWWWLKPRLESCGRQVATISLEPLQGDIDGYAEQIARRVAWLREQTRAERVVLVGHSMGGLACLAYLRRYGEDHVERLVMLGTPYAGTRLLQPGWGRSLDQMCANSAWLVELTSFFEEMPLSIPSLVCQAAEDCLLMPAETVLMPGAQARRLVQVGHLGLLTSAQVLDELLRASEA
jgi:triacylglycerol lipase